MKRNISVLRVLSLATLVPPLMAASSVSWTAEPFDEIKVIVEINATDGDAGFHVLFDAGAWKEVRIDDPTGKKLFDEKISKKFNRPG